MSFAIESMTQQPDPTEPVAFVNQEQIVILEKKGLWPGSYRESFKEAKNDPLNLNISLIRCAECTRGASGFFKVEGLAGCTDRISFEWSYVIRGADELWKINGMRRDLDGCVYMGEIYYGKDGTRMDNLSKNDFFIRAFTWLFKEEEIAIPLWVGELSFTAGNSRWKLILHDCRACDSGPMCTC